MSAPSILILRLRLPRERAVARPLIVSRQFAADDAKAGLHGVRLVQQLELDDLCCRRSILGGQQGRILASVEILR